MAAYMFHLAGINMLNHDREYFLACFGAKKDILERMVARWKSTDNSRDMYFKMRYEKSRV